MAKLVLDASVFLSWLFPDEENEWSKSLVEGLRNDRIVVPAHWTTEIANGLLVGYRRKRINRAQIDGYLDQLAVLPIEAESPLSVGETKRVVSLSDKHGLTVYDAMYLDVAQRRNLALGTLDSALIRAANAERVILR